MKRSGLVSISYYLILVCLSMTPKVQAEYIYTFDRYPRGENSGSGVQGELTFSGNPQITLSPFDGDNSGFIQNDRALLIRRSAGQYASALTVSSGDNWLSYTIEAFIRLDSIPAGSLAANRYGIVRLDSGVGQISSLYVITTEGVPRLTTVIRQSDNSWIQLVGNSSLQTGRWYHVMLRVEDQGNDTVANDTVRLYLNGSQDAVRSAMALSSMNSIQAISVGTVSTAERAFDGAIDQVRIRRGIDQTTYFDEISNAHLSLQGEPYLSIEKDAGSSNIRLLYQARDAAFFQVLATESPLKPGMSFQTVGQFQIKTSNLAGEWLDESVSLLAQSNAPSEQWQERYYRVEQLDYTESLTPTVRSVLVDGLGDFDPWNEIRWAYWYENGRIARTFQIDTTVRFAERTTDWTPDLSALPSNGTLFLISTDQGIDIDGNGIVIDLRNPAYYNRTVNQLYSGGSSELDNTTRYNHCFRFAQTLAPDKPPTVIRNLTLKGFVQSIRTTTAQSHPLHIRDCLFTRNSWGTYFSGKATLVTNCDYLENGRGGKYLGVGSHENGFRNNRYRDNNYVETKSYGDFVFDTSYGNLAENNQHLPSLTTTTRYHAAYAFYRNMGEDGVLRENRPHHNIIRGNTIDGYSIAIDIGSRMGRRQSYDLSSEGRDHADTNLITQNTIRNTTIGIRILTPHNIIEGNIFENVNREIVLQAVFYNLFGTTINSQPGAQVHLWYTLSDYLSYLLWFPYQSQLNSGIPASQKLIHARSDYGAPNYPSSSSGTFIQAPTLLVNNRLQDIYSSGGVPIDIAVGDFYENHPGDEFAVIWNQPVSNISGTNYYSIIIYDRRGVEIDRGGRSQRRYGAITAGNFLSATGDEIAVVHSEPENGFYPVKIFRRRFEQPHVILLPDNPHPIAALAAGNFQTGGDGLDELAVIFSSGSQEVVYIKPTDRNWQRTTSGMPIRLHDIAAGEFDGNAANGEELAGISRSPDPTTGRYPIYFMRPGSSGFYQTSAANHEYPFDAIAAGNFDGAPGIRDEVAVATSVAIDGVYPIQFYVAGFNNPFKICRQEVLGVSIKSLDAGYLVIEPTLSDYEKADGFSSENYGETIKNWGDHVLVLPAFPQTTAIPAFWLNSDPSDPNRSHLRTTPILR